MHGGKIGSSGFPQKIQRASIDTESNLDYNNLFTSLANFSATIEEPEQKHTPGLNNVGGLQSFKVLSDPLKYDNISRLQKTKYLGNT